MIIKAEETNFNDLSLKIIDGVGKAVRKLVETSAKNDESLVIGNKDGSFKTVPAKELLKTFANS